jgi:hypothetical protein
MVLVNRFNIIRGKTAVSSYSGFIQKFLERMSCQYSNAVNIPVPVIGKCILNQLIGIRTYVNIQHPVRHIRLIDNCRKGFVLPVPVGSRIINPEVQLIGKAVYYFYGG